MDPWVAYWHTVPVVFGLCWAPAPAPFPLLVCVVSIRKSGWGICTSSLRWRWRFLLLCFGVWGVLGVFLLLRQGRIGDGQWLSSTNSDIWGSCGFPSWLLSGLLPWPWFSEHPPRTSGLVLDIFFWGPIWQNRAATGVSCDFWALAWAMPLHEGLFNAAFTLHQHGCLQWIHTPLVGLVGLVGDQGRCLASRLSPFWVSPSWSTRVYWSGLWSGGKLNNKHMFYVCFLVWVYMYNYCIYIYMYTHKHPPVKLEYKTNQHIWVWH